MSSCYEIFAICPLKGNTCLLIKWLEIALLIHRALLLSSNFSISEARQKALFWTTSINSSMQFLYFNLNLYVVHKWFFEQIASEFCDLRVIPVEKEIPLSNAFHPLQTFQLGSCTKSVQINLIYHQCVQLPMKGRKVKMQVFRPIVPGAIHLDFLVRSCCIWIACHKGC